MSSRGRKRGRSGEPSIQTVRERTVLLERQVKLSDFVALIWEGHSLPSVFNDRGWAPILDQREEGMELVSFIEIVTEFYKELGAASPDDGGAYRISVRGAPVIFSADGLAAYLGIPRLLDAYPNLPVRESGPSGDAAQSQDEGLDYTDEIDTLVDHEVRDLIVGPDAPVYDGSKSIRQADLSSFFKIMNLIIANNIDPRQHKTEVGMDRARFMIRVARGIPIDLVGYIFERIRSEARFITIDILPFGILITRFLLHAGVVSEPAERSRFPMAPINSTTLSRSTGHSRFHFRGAVPDRAEIQRDGQPGDTGVSAGETSTQPETSRTYIREELADILRAEIGVHTSAVIDAVHTAMSELRTEIMATVSGLRTEVDELRTAINANNATQVTVSTRLTQVETQLAAVEDVCRDLAS